MLHKLAAFALLLATLAAQVPAPDFSVELTPLTLTSCTPSFHVQGHPFAPVQILMTLQDPFLTPPSQLSIFPFLQMQTNMNGVGHLTLPPLTWQGPLPDVWFGALIMTPAGFILPEVVNIGGVIGCIGCGNPLDTHSHAWIYDRLAEELHVRVFGSDGPYSVWEVPCPPPAVGAPWLAGAGSTYLGSTTAAGGNSNWDGSVPLPPPGGTKCIVIRSNGLAGVVIGVKTITN